MYSCCRDCVAKERKGVTRFLGVEDASAQCDRGGLLDGYWYTVASPIKRIGLEGVCIFFFLGLLGNFEMDALK